MDVDMSGITEALREAMLGYEPEVVTLARGDAVAIERTIDTVLAPVQRSVGERWESGAMTVRRAQAVTDVIDTALTALWDAAEQFVSPRGPRVGVACVPGEWHDLAARMAAVTMRCAGCQVTNLGPSVTLPRIADYVARERPHGVAISVSMTTHLVGAAELIDVIHRRGVPVIAGGTAFGPDATRADALGADAWCADGHSAVGVLRGWERELPVVDTDGSSARSALSGRDRARVVDSALRTLRRAGGPPLDLGDPDPSEVEHSRSGLELLALLDFTEGAVLTGDDTVLTGALRRWAQRHALVGVAPDRLVRYVDALIGALEPGPRRTLLLSARADFTLQE